MNLIRAPTTRIDLEPVSIPAHQGFGTSEFNTRFYKVPYYSADGAETEVLKVSGQMTTTVPRIHADGKRIASFHEVFLQALLDTNPHSIVNRWEYSITGCAISTSDALAYHPDGRVKIVLDAEPLRTLNPESIIGDRVLEHMLTPEGFSVDKRRNLWALHLVLGEQGNSDFSYSDLDGVEFTPRDIERYANIPLTEKGFRNNPFLKVLVPDSSLREQVARKLYTYHRKYAFKGARFVVHEDAPTEVLASWTSTDFFHPSALENGGISGDPISGVKYGRMGSVVLGSGVRRQEVVSLPSQQKLEPPAESSGLIDRLRNYVRTSL